MGRDERSSIRLDRLRDPWVRRLPSPSRYQSMHGTGIGAVTLCRWSVSGAQGLGSNEEFVHYEADIR